MANLFNMLALALTALVAWLYALGIEHSFFWIYPWYDSLLHFLGGTVMGLWACAVSVRLNLSLKKTLFFVFVVVILGSSAWEIFEYLLELSGGAYDTLFDSLSNTGGALIIFVLYAVFSRFRV